MDVSQPKDSHWNQHLSLSASLLVIGIELSLMNILLMAISQVRLALLVSSDPQCSFLAHQLFSPFHQVNQVKVNTKPNNLKRHI